MEATADALKEVRKRMKLKIIGGGMLDLTSLFAANGVFEVAA